MSKLNRIAIALLLAQPLVVGAGAAFAFSMVDTSTTPGLEVTDPGAALDNLADHYSDAWGQPNADYSDMLLQPGLASDASSDATALTPARPPIGHR